MDPQGALALTATKLEHTRQKQRRRSMDFDGHGSILMPEERGKKPLPARPLKEVKVRCAKLSLLLSRAGQPSL